MRCAANWDLRKLGMALIVIVPIALLALVSNTR